MWVGCYYRPLSPANENTEDMCLLVSFSNQLYQQEKPNDYLLWNIYPKTIFCPSSHVKAETLPWFAHGEMYTLLIAL